MKRIAIQIAVGLAIAVISFLSASYFGVNAKLPLIIDRLNWQSKVIKAKHPEVVSPNPIASKFNLKPSHIGENMFMSKNKLTAIEIETISKAGFDAIPVMLELSPDSTSPKTKKGFYYILQHRYEPSLDMKTPRREGDE